MYIGKLAPTPMTVLSREFFDREQTIEALRNIIAQYQDIGYELGEGGDFRGDLPVLSGCPGVGKVRLDDCSDFAQYGTSRCFSADQGLGHHLGSMARTCGRRPEGRVS